MKTVDHSKNRTPREIEDLDYPHKCECGAVIRHTMHYKTHWMCDAQ